jgi:hypothetical protein
VSRLDERRLKVARLERGEDANVDPRFDWQRMTEERNRRRAEDSRRMVRFYAGMQRAREIREERERKAAREAVGGGGACGT